MSRAQVEGVAVARQRVVGVDLGATGVRAAQLDLSRTPPRLEKYGQVAIPPGAIRDGEVIDAEAVVQALRQLFAAVRFSEKQVTLGVANQRVVVRQVDLLWMPAKELKKSLAMLVQDSVPMPVDQAVLDFVPVAEITGDDGARMLRGLLVAGAEDMLTSAADAADRAGLRPQVIDLVPFALVRALAGVPAPGAVLRPEAIVDVGGQITNIVVHEGGVPRFVRILVQGGDDITSQVADLRGMPHTDAETMKRRFGLVWSQSDDPETASLSQSVVNATSRLIDEIRGSLDYYVATAGSAPLGRVVLSGGGSLMPGFPQALASALRAPVEMANVLASVEVGATGLTDEQLAIVAPTAGVAIGLAMGGRR